MQILRMKESEEQIQSQKRSGDNHATKEKWDFGDFDGFCVTKGWYIDASVRSDIPINVPITLNKTCFSPPPPPPALLPLLLHHLLLHQQFFRDLLVHVQECKGQVTRT